MENKSKPTILYVITQGEWGGAQRYIFDIATSEQAKNYSIEIATGTSLGQELRDKINRAGIILHQTKYLVRDPSPINDIKAVTELKNLFEKIRPTVIHLNSSKAGVIGSLAFRLWKEKNDCRLIYTVHGWVLNEPLNPLTWYFYYITEKITANIKDVIICVSEFDRQTALRYKIGSPEKLTTIHNGIDSSFPLLSKEGALQELLQNASIPIPDNAIYIGTIGNFYKNKGFDYFIEALSLLIHNYQIPLVGCIIGDGRLRGHIENLIKNYDIKNNIILVGKKESAQKLLPGFDIYVSSSIKEGLPYSIMEAMAAQLPIVATGVGGVPELIGESDGLCVPAQDSKQLAAAIKYFIDHPDQAQTFGAHAQKSVHDNFSLTTMVQKTFTTYTKK